MIVTSACSPQERVERTTNFGCSELDRQQRSIPEAAETPLKIDNILQELGSFLDLDTIARFIFRLANKLLELRPRMDVRLS